MVLRKLTSEERRLLQFLIGKSSHELSDNEVDKILVSSVSDGKMGSLLLYPEHMISHHRTFGSQISECQFQDADGVDVVVSLNVDNDGALFELDIWKVDYSELGRIPELQDFRNIK